MKLIYIYSLLILAVSCKNDVKNQTKEQVENSTVELTSAQYKSAQIETELISLREMSSLIRVNGIIDVPPQNMYSVSAPMGGYLKSTHLLPGMHVKKGEAIATLEDQQFVNLQQDYLTVQSKMIYAKSELERQSELNKNQASSDKVYQFAQMEYNSLRISSKALSEKLRMINVNPSTLSEFNLSKSVKIFSSIDGYVSAVNVNIGKYINPIDVLFELVNPTDIHLNLKVFEEDIAKLRIGQKLIAFTNSNPDKIYICEILLISQNINSDGTIEVHCHFENYDRTLLPGMYMNAEVEINIAKSKAITEKAVVNFEGKNYIFKQIGKKKYKMMQVELGNKENGFVEILKGEPMHGEQIVVSGAYTLLMMLKNVEEQ
jgi:cobalt-zinc-cadmium efflux system membrane fusion protein